MSQRWLLSPATSSRQLAQNGKKLVSWHETLSICLWCSLSCQQEYIVTRRSYVCRLLWQSCGHAGIWDTHSQVRHSALHLAVAGTSTHYSVWTEWHRQDLPYPETCQIHRLFVSLTDKAIVTWKLYHLFVVFFMGYNLAQSKVSWLIFLLLISSFFDICWLRGTVVERWSLTGELSLSCARLKADGWPFMWVNHPL